MIFLAIETLIEHLKRNEKEVNIITEQASLNKVRVSSYDISPSTLDIFTTCGHRVTVNISNFKEVAFDAIVSTATTSEEMLNCFDSLSDSIRYNAYLKDANNNYMIDFAFITV